MGKIADWFRTSISNGTRMGLIETLAKEKPNHEFYGDPDDAHVKLAFNRILADAPQIDLYCGGRADLRDLEDGFRLFLKNSPEGRIRIIQDRAEKNNVTAALPKEIKEHIELRVLDNPAGNHFLVAGSSFLSYRDGRKEDDPPAIIPPMLGRARSFANDFGGQPEAEAYLVRGNFNAPEETKALNINFDKLWIKGRSPQAICPDPTYAMD